MTETVRNWRDAKLPAWVKESMEEDMKQAALKAALAWPTEAKPTPLPFRWGEYDRLMGEPTPGRYWAVQSANRIEAFDLATSADLQDDERKSISHWKYWVFKSIGASKWSSAVIRGPLFASEREARLYRLWLLCEGAAETLRLAREGL